MKKFLVCLLSVFLIASLTACGSNNGDAESVSSADALAKKLANESDKILEISEEIVLTEPIEIVGNKEIVGSGTITVAGESVKETYMISVAEGAQLTVGGETTINLASLANGIHVKDGAAFHMNGGTITGGYTNILCSGKSTFTWNAGTVSSAINDAIVVEEDAKITITSSDAQLTGVAARGLYLYGEGVIENTTMTDSMDSMIKVASTGNLTVKGGKISDAGLHGIDNAGKLLVTGGTIFENYESGICNTGTFEMTGGTLMNNKNKGVLNKAGTAKIVSADAVLSGNKFAIGNEEGAYFELAKAKILQSTTTNIYAYGGEMYIHDIVLATSGSNNTRIVAADVRMEDMEIKGINASGSRTMHGLLLEGGHVSLDNVIIGNTTGNAIRNKGGHIEGKDVTIKDVKNIGIGNANQDVTGREGVIELDNITIENVQVNNVLVEGGLVKLTNATLERCQTNNIKVSEGKLVMKKSVINGNVKDAKSNNHAVYMVGGTFEANNVKIQNAAGAMLRINGEEALFKGNKITFKNSGSTGINMSIGTVKIDGLTTSNIKDHNVMMSKGTVSLKNATLCKTKNNNVRMTGEGNLELNTVEIQGTVAGVEEVVHGLFVSKGTTTAKNLTIKDVKWSGVRVNGPATVKLDDTKIVNPGQIAVQVNDGTTVITGLTTSGVPGNNIHLYGDGNARLTLKDSSLGTTKNNSVKVESGSLNMQNVVVEGLEADAPKNAHGIYATGGTIAATQLTVKNTLGTESAAIRTVGTPKLTVDEVEIKDSGKYAFRLGGGTVTVSNLTTSDIAKHNFAIEDESCDVAVTDAVLCATENNNVRINKGTTYFENVEILGHVDGVTEVVHGFFVSAGKTTAKNLMIKDVKNSAIRVNGGNVVAEDITIEGTGKCAVEANGGTTQITKLTTENVGDNNVWAYGTGVVKMSDSELGKTTVHNVKTEDNSKIYVSDVLIKGATNEGAYGVLVQGGDAELKRITIKDANKAGIRINRETSEAIAEDITVTDSLIGVSGSAGKLTLTGLDYTTPGLDSKVGTQNVLVEGADITINDTELNPVRHTNNVKVTSGILTLNNVKILGHSAGNTGNHGIYATGGEIYATVLTIQGTKGAALRIAAGTTVVEAENVKLLNTGTNAIQNNGGDTTITGLTTENINGKNIELSGNAVVKINGAEEIDSVLGASAGASVTVSENSTLTLNNVTLNGTTNSGNYSIDATGGDVELNDVTINGAGCFVAIDVNDDNSEVTGTNVTVNDAQYSIYGQKGAVSISNLTSKASTQTLSVVKASVTINGGTFYGTTGPNARIINSGIMTLNDVTILKKANEYSVQADAGTTNIESLNRTATEKASVYNKTENLNLAGVINASVYNDAAVTVNATSSLEGSALVIDWKDTDMIPDNTVGIQFVNDEDMNKSVSGISLGTNVDGMYDPMFYNSQMLLVDPTDIPYTVHNYGELTDAITDIEEKGYAKATITIADSFDFTGTVIIPTGSNITIKDDDTENARTLTKTTASKMFVMSENSTLTLKSSGTVDNPKLIIDGNKISSTAYATVIHARDVNACNVNILEGVCIKNNYSKGNGSVISFDKSNSSNLYIEGAKFENNIAIEKAGGVLTSGGATITIKDSIFVGNQAKYGGVIELQASANITNCTFTSNKDVGLGGGVFYCWYGTDLTLTDCTFTSNTTAQTGKDIYVAHADAAIKLAGKTKVEIIGGATSKVSVTGTLVDGSDVVVDWTPKLSENYEGIIFASAEIMNASRPYIRLGANMTNNDYGLSYNQSEAKAYLTKVTQVNNFDEFKSALTSATAGVTKVIQLTNDIVFSENLSIPANRDVEIVDDGTKHTMTRTTFTTDRRVFLDVAAGARLTFRSSGDDANPKLIINGNYKDANGNIAIAGSGNCAILVGAKGGSIINIYKGVVFKNNNTTGAGGVIRMESSKNTTNSTLNIYGGQFKDNIVSNNGSGVIFIADNNKATIKNALFSGNQAKESGAIYTSVSTVVVENCIFDNNKALNEHGGAIKALWSSNLTVSNCTFNNNSAKQYGGAIHVGNSSILTINGSTFIGNSAQYAGAILMFSPTTVSDTTFKQNSATAEGGAMYLDKNAKSVTLTDCVFDSNNSGTNGGAICFSGDSSTILNLVGTKGPEKALFTKNNSISTKGGAIYLNNGQLNVNGYTFNGNTQQDIYKNNGSISGDGKYSTN